MDTPTASLHSAHPVGGDDEQKPNVDQPPPVPPDQEPEVVPVQEPPRPENPPLIAM